MCDITECTKDIIPKGECGFRGVKCQPLPRYFTASHLVLSHSRARDKVVTTQL